MFLHYLHAVERAGLLLSAESFGRQMWYPDAVKMLMATQNEDGSWSAGWNNTWDTCFAVLFLRRAGHALGE
jgi:hypothetical protein